MVIAYICIAAAAIILIALSIIDLKHGLLPDKLVAPLLLLGLAFHVFTNFSFATPLDIITGCLMGGGLLYAVRIAANYYYKTDALGLGDVKLLAAAGAWLGPQDVLIALIAGALAGVVHGLGMAIKVKVREGRLPDLGALSLPAGPGFIIGIVIAALMKFQDLPYAYAGF